VLELGLWCLALLLTIFQLYDRNDKSNVIHINYTKSDGKSIESILNHVYIGVTLHNVIYVYCLAPHGLYA
jgi:hypothetical protein